MASDPLLWSALCHYDFKDYVLKRWKKDDGSVSIGERYFAGESRSSLAYYNAISRLWWSGYLTYDDTEEDDPWKLTRTLMSAQQIQKDLFDQAFSNNRDVVKGLLKALARIQEEQKNACTPVFRKCCNSFFNYYGAVTSVDTLSDEEIESLAYEYMKKEVSKEKSKSTVVLKDRLIAKNKKGSKKKKRK